MSEPVLRTQGGVTLIGGGSVTREDLAEALAIAPHLVAADSGADQALAMGYRPEAVIGDFDSLGNDTRGALPGDALHHVAEQDSTDFQKCLSRIRARFVLAVGFDGRRLDHTLAALNVMVRMPAPTTIMLAAEDVVFVCPPTLALDLPDGTRFSLFPMGQAQGTSEGLEWPIAGISFAPSGPGGTSNRVTGPVRLTMEGPMLVMVPRETLRHVLVGLRLW
ncbi:thiamine diphosphokinase [Paracoccus sp. TK19116]|uniref:Thiamine diphosphokinase n=1 Tax=Paracoccus albicereus TaxID=2922394 RepID=A0ABT1MNK2_9RHOB|nr:thiamine diphosphokinase [Paracoccus albicereus]MCQ0969869.1 thiamine diphosphokinase [Paracoccus albicereus]